MSSNDRPATRGPVLVCGLNHLGIAVVRQLVAKGETARALASADEVAGYSHELKRLGVPACIGVASSAGELEAAGLGQDLVVQLVLKLLHFAGELTGIEISQRLGLEFRRTVERPWRIAVSRGAASPRARLRGHGNGIRRARRRRRSPAPRCSRSNGRERQSRCHRGRGPACP